MITCAMCQTSKSEAACTLYISPLFFSQLQVLPFYRGVATGGSDFVTAVGQSVVISAGFNSTQIPVTIIGDATPELNESLVITVTGVEVVTSGEVPISLPLLGNLTSSTLTILENDDPHGLFTVYGSGGAGVVYIREPDTFSFSVMLTVERTRGTFGDVAVRWNVVDGRAIGNLDYAGTGMELRFAEGESRTTVTLTILGDNEPEIDEDFVVTLTDPTGGARIATGDEGRTLIIIEANDGAAGIVGLAPLSRSTVVGEGESATLTLVRGVSMFGAVEVEWVISGTSGNASLEFDSVSGVARFEEVRIISHSTLTNTYNAVHVTYVAVIKYVSVIDFVTIIFVDFSKCDDLECLCGFDNKMDLPLVARMTCYTIHINLSWLNCGGVLLVGGIYL